MITNKFNQITKLNNNNFIKLLRYYTVKELNDYHLLSPSNIKSAINTQNLQQVPFKGIEVTRQLYKNKMVDENISKSLLSVEQQKKEEKLFSIDELLYDEEAIKKYVGEEDEQIQIGSVGGSGGGGEDVKDIHAITEEDLAQQYVDRLLLEELRNQVKEDEFFFELVSQIPEFNDYTDHVNREMKKLEIEEMDNPLPDNARLTEYYEKKRIMKVDEIRKIHLKTVSHAIYKKIKEELKEADKKLEKKIQNIMKSTGLTREQMMEHKDYAYLFDDDIDVEDNLYRKDDLSELMDEIAGPLESIPPIMKTIFESSKIQLNKEWDEKDKQLLLEHSGNSNNSVIVNQQQFEEELLSLKNKTISQQQQQQQQQQQYLKIDDDDNINNIYGISNSNNNNKNNNQQPPKKLSFTDIVQSTKQSNQPLNKKQPRDVFTNEEDFDLKSILNNMSKKA